MKRFEKAEAKIGRCSLMALPVCGIVAVLTFIATENLMQALAVMGCGAVGLTVALALYCGVLLWRELTTTAEDKKNAV